MLKILYQYTGIRGDVHHKQNVKMLVFLGKLSISIRTRNHILFETYTNLFFR